MSDSGKYDQKPFQPCTLAHRPRPVSGPWSAPEAVGARSDARREVVFLLPAAEGFWAGDIFWVFLSVSLAGLLIYKLGRSLNSGFPQHSSKKICWINYAQNTFVSVKPFYLP